MRFEFTVLPGAVIDTPRPTVEVAVDGPSGSVSVVALVDTGTLHNRFGWWVADALGIDLTQDDIETIGVGGQRVEARTVVLPLRVGDFMWEAPVSFCKPWPFAFQLVGQEGFLRWFRVTLDAADRSLELVPIGS